MTQIKLQSFCLALEARRERSCWRPRSCSHLHRVIGGDLITGEYFLSGVLEEERASLKTEDVMMSESFVASLPEKRLAHFPFNYTPSSLRVTGFECVSLPETLPLSSSFRGLGQRTRSRGK